MKLSLSVLIRASSRCRRGLWVSASCSQCLVKGAGIKSSSFREEKNRPLALLYAKWAFDQVTA